MQAGDGKRGREEAVNQPVRGWSEVLRRRQIPARPVLSSRADAAEQELRRDDRPAIREISPDVADKTADQQATAPGTSSS